MAIVKRGLVTKGLSGALGKEIVFRQIGGQTIVGVMPTRGSAEPTAKQKAQREKFGRAIRYARTQMGNPEVMNFYKEVSKTREGSTVMSVAVGDYFNAPEIDSIKMNSGVVIIAATDDVKVTGVAISHYDGQGNLLESAGATNDGGIEWTCALTQSPAKGNKVVAVASDLAGNQTTKEQVI